MKCAPKNNKCLTFYQSISILIASRVLIDGTFNFFDIFELCMVKLNLKIRPHFNFLVRKKKSPSG